jgi:plasmid stabilization system protein ParE
MTSCAAPTEELPRGRLCGPWLGATLRSTVWRTATIRATAGHGSHRRIPPPVRPYLIFYRLNNIAAEIVRVLHERRDAAQVLSTSLDTA